MKVYFKNCGYPIIGILVCAMMFTGCSSTSEVVEEAPPEQTAAPEPVAEPTPPPVVMQEVPEPEPEPVLDTVFYFDFDQASLRPEARAMLSEHAARIKQTDSTVRIEGYADERGSEQYNKALGERRANAVKEFLVSMGVSASNIQTVSYGESNPRADGKDESAWQENRRVEIK